MRSIYICKEAVEQRGWKNVLFLWSDVLFFYFIDYVLNEVLHKHSW